MLLLAMLVLTVLLIYNMRDDKNDVGCNPWYAFVDGRNQDFDSLEEAKKAIDNYQIIRKQRLEEYCKKYPDLAKYKY